VRSIEMSMPVRICMSVCLSACISQRPHVQTSRNFLYVLTVAVDRSFSDDYGIGGLYSDLLKRQHTKLCSLR